MFGNIAVSTKVINGRYINLQMEAREMAEDLINSFSSELLKLKGITTKVSWSKKNLVSCSTQIRDDNKFIRGKRKKREGKNKKQKMLKRKRELEPDLGITNNKEKIYHQFVSEKSTDPVPEEVILSQTSLKKFYTPLYKNKVRLFTERNKIKENILIAKFFPFDEMKEEKLDDWTFLSNEYHQLAAGAHESCENFLQNNSIPSFSQLNYNKQENAYCPGDFSSAITYTFDDFSNKPHCDNDEDNWTLIGFVPIFKDGTVAREGFDIEGGEFVLRDLKVFIGFSRENGVILLILKTSQGTVLALAALVKYHLSCNK
ncbi:hypothetical protein BY996DRAFT_8684059 [Phakopsora pachyrhizi]|nr:hypothetical protein BY996DRAFT_8684059 [Phakopsora pachyrhizi]